MFKIILAASTLALAPACALAQGADPETVQVNSADAHRFIAVFDAAQGQPTAQALQAGYLDGASQAVDIFTPDRIRSAEHLAGYIAEHSEQYRRAIDVCLPIAESMTPELRSIYAATRALLPDRELPDIHVLFGAGNSGGTAGPGAQVLGLEVICAIKDSELDIRSAFRMFFAHETVHTFQDQPDPHTLVADPLLFAVLMEGVPDFIALQTTGELPWADRDRWARENEAMLWAQFARDRVSVHDGFALGEGGMSFDESANAALHNWVGNYGQAPEGWYFEAGYWIGRQIAQGYYDQADDKAAALAALIALEDPAGILQASGYAGHAGAIE
ncbi:hypothetical protein [Maricaulis sp.]|uniref:hypothetical protein n=1 Tax=Maricaulis sp. TaxID=1486257 RepID=UPI003A91C8B1